MSSPLQAASERRTVRQPNSSNPKKHAIGHAFHSVSASKLAEGSEDDDDDDAFEPVRFAGRRRAGNAQWQPSFGSRIIVDQKMAALDENHRLIVEDFLQNARKMSQNILMKDSLHGPPFTDTVLREFAINFPNTVEEMKQVPGVNEAKVDVYGTKFLPLIKGAQKFYEDLIRQDESEQPQDPNHQNVIDLVTDDEGKEHGSDDYGDDDWSFHEDEDVENEDPQFESDQDTRDEGEPNYRSQYFDTRPPDVQAFNSQFAVTKQRREQSTERRGATAARPSPSKASEKRFSSGAQRRWPTNRGNYRSGFKRGRGEANVGKRKSSGNKRSVGLGKTTSTRRGSAGSGRGRPRDGGISMMPV